MRQRIFDMNLPVDAHAELEVQKTAVASYYAKKFSKMSGHELKYITVYLSSDYETVFIEEFVDPKNFQKYINNKGEIKANAHDPKEQEVVQAFVHFSLHKSGGQLMVSDVQGWFPLLCDPEICTLNVDSGLGTVGNHNKTAINNFSSEHTCSQVCRKLGLTVLPAAPAP